MMKLERASALGVVILCALLGVVWALLELRPNASIDEVNPPIEVPDDYQLETTPGRIDVTRVGQELSDEPKSDGLKVMVLEQGGLAVNDAELWGLEGVGADWRYLERSDDLGCAPLVFVPSEPDSWLLVCKDGYHPYMVPFRAFNSLAKDADGFRRLFINAIEPAEILVTDLAERPIPDAVIRVSYPRERDFGPLIETCPSEACKRYLDVAKEREGVTDSAGVASVMVSSGAAAKLDVRALGYIPLSEDRMLTSGERVSLALEALVFAGIEGVIYADGSACPIEGHVSVRTSLGARSPISREFLLKSTESKLIASELRDFERSLGSPVIRWIWARELDVGAYPAAVEAKLSSRLMDLPGRATRLEFRYLHDLSAAAISRPFPRLNYNVSTCKVVIQFRDAMGQVHKPVDEWVVAMSGTGSLEARGVGSSRVSIRELGDRDEARFELFVAEGDYEVVSLAVEPHFQMPRATAEFEPVSFRASGDRVAVEVPLDLNENSGHVDLEVRVWDQAGLEVTSWRYWLLKNGVWDAWSGASTQGVQLFQRLLPGEYLFVVTADGLKKHKERVTITDGAKGGVDIMLVTLEQGSDQEVYENSEWVVDINALSDLEGSTTSKER